MPRTYFYPASRAHHALCMAIDHGFRFVKANGDFWSLEGIASIDPASDYKFRVAPESALLFCPQVGDMISHLGLRAWRIDRMDLYAFYHPATPNESLERFTLKADNTVIVQRHGKPFHWPEAEG